MNKHDNIDINNNQGNSIISKNPLVMNQEIMENLNKRNIKMNDVENLILHNIEFSYNFLAPKEDSKIFEFNYQNNFFNNLISCEEFDKLKERKIRLLITIDLNDDCSANGVLLNKTLDFLLSNISKLKKFKLTKDNIVFFIFFEEINMIENYEYFFKHQEKKDNIIFGNIMQYYNYDIYLFNTKFGFDIIHSIYNKDHNLFVLKLKNGIRFKNPETIHSLIESAIIKDGKKRALIIPLIEMESLNDQPQNLFTEFENYENFLYNLYDLNYFDMSISIPQNNYVTFYNIDKKNIDIFCQFYASTYFTDYVNNHSLPIYIKESGFNVVFASGIICYKNRNHITFTQMKINYINKRSNDFLALNDLTKNFSEFPFLKQLIIIHRYIGITFSFLYPSFSTLFIYCIFVEAFKSKDTKSSFFFSCVNIFFIILIIFTGYIPKHIEEENDIYEFQSSIDEMNSIYFFLYDVYYIFTLLCSFFSLYNIDHNKPFSLYKFNTTMCLTLILINFFVAIIPLLFYIKSYSKRIIKSLKYLFLASPGYNGLFNILAIVNSFRNNSAKAICVLLMYILNGLILIFGYCLNTRKRRIHFIETLSITFTIYNSIKVICIIINNFINNDGFYESEDDIQIENVKINDELKQTKTSDFKIEMSQIKSNKNNTQVDKINEEENEKSFDKENKKKNPIRQEDVSIQFENGENN